MSMAAVRQAVGEPAESIPIPGAAATTTSPALLWRYSEKSGEFDVLFNAAGRVLRTSARK